MEKGDAGLDPAVFKRLGARGLEPSHEVIGDSGRTKKLIDRTLVERCHIDQLLKARRPVPALDGHQRRPADAQLLGDFLLRQPLGLPRRPQASQEGGQFSNRHQFALHRLHLNLTMSVSK